MPPGFRWVLAVDGGWHGISGGIGKPSCVSSRGCLTSTTPRPHTLFPPPSPQNVLHYSYGIEAPIKFLGGRLWVRVSAHVYNSLEDYGRLADAVVGIGASGGAAGGGGV